MLLLVLHIFYVESHLGTDTEELRILVNAANKFQHLIRI